MKDNYSNYHEQIAIDIFSANGNNYNGHNGHNGHNNNNILAKIKVNVSLSELYLGITKNISYTYSKNGNLCNGQQRVNIAPGSKPGDIIRIKHKDYKDGFCGQVLVEIDYINDGKYNVKGYDLILIEPISINLCDALCGGNFIINHFNEKLFVECNYDIIQSDELYKIAGKGMFRSNGQNGGRGDLYIRFNIIMPDKQSLNKQTIQKICQLLSSTNNNINNNHRFNGQHSSTSNVKLQVLSEWDELGFSRNDKNKFSKNNQYPNDTNEQPPDCKQM